MPESEPSSSAILRRMVERTVAFIADVPDERSSATQVLLHLNQLAAQLGRAEGAGEAHPVLTALFSLLAEMASRGEERKAYVQAMLLDAGALAEAGAVWAQPVAVGAGQGSSPRRRRGAIAPEYYIHKGARGLRLAEHRPGSEKDFYITKEDYDLAVQAIAETARPKASFHQIYERFLQLGGTEVSSAYPLRVVLRFLRSRKPPLVTGQRGKYQIQGVEPLKGAAAEAWEGLKRR